MRNRTEMFNPIARAASNIKQAKPSWFKKTYQVSRKKIVVILLIVVVAVSSFAWAVDRINTHKSWVAMIDKSRDFRDHMEKAYVTFSESDLLGDRELRYALRSIEELENLDKTHWLELSKIENFLMDARVLNYTQASELDSQASYTVNHNIKQIGPKIYEAYCKITNFTSVSNQKGAPFLYFGPSPPDEATLQEAVDLAVNADALIKPILSKN
ncbi:MAG: hypothetical protein ACFCUE_09935 [Candidatus Bathyarchaeia archaeon]|jgi:hypothetical protein